MTVAISLLYEWFGVSSQELLQVRLEGIAVGAVIGVASSWLVRPVRERDALRHSSREWMSPQPQVN